MAFKVDVVLKLLSSSSETPFFFPPVNGYLLKESHSPLPLSRLMFTLVCCALNLYIFLQPKKKRLSLTVAFATRSLDIHVIPLAVASSRMLMYADVC